MSVGFQAILLYMLVCVDGPLNASTDWLIVEQQNAYHLHTHMMCVYYALCMYMVTHTYAMYL